MKSLGTMSDEETLRLELQTKERDFRSAITNWRKKATELEQLRIGTEDVEVLRSTLKELSVIFSHVDGLFGELDALLELSGRPKSDIDSRFESIQEQNYALTSKIVDTISSIKESGPLKENPAEDSSNDVDSENEQSQNTSSPRNDDQTRHVQAEHVTPAQTSANDTNPLSNTANTDCLQELFGALVNQVNLNRLPPPEPGIFDGDPLLYASWKAAYLTLIGSQNISCAEKIYYLKKYLSKTVASTVQGFLTLANEDAYESAWERLDKRYGNSFVIANAFRDQLEKWPEVHTRDGEGLRKLSDFLRQCQAAMRADRSNLMVLDDEREQGKILKKLPDWIITRWSRAASTYRQQFLTHPPFHIFANFMEQEADLACDPITSIQAIKNRPVNRESNKERVFKARNFASEGKETERQPRERKCLFCEDGSHYLPECKKFGQKAIEERKEYVKSKRLCWACLRRGHRSKECRIRLKCRTCEKMHPTILHDEKREQAAPKLEKPDLNDKRDCASSRATSHKSFSSNGLKSSMIVPVWVAHEDNPGSEILTYAMLDTQSDTTFILDKIWDQLGCDGVKTNLKLSTMTAQEQLIETVKVNGLVVRGMSCSEKIKLPPCFTREMMPAERSHIPTPDMAKRWPHLEQLADKISMLQDCDVGILIGYNCSRALAPQEVIYGACSEDPYGQRTELGWTIVGTVGQVSRKDDPIGVSHRIMTYGDAQYVESDGTISEDNETVKSRELSIMNTTKEILTTLETDFKDTSSCETLSVEDKKFLDILGSGVKQQINQHYEMPLPFKDGKPTLPDNREMAKRRLSSLKAKFQRDQDYKKKYITFMENIIKKGDAETVPRAPIVSSESGSPSQCWYLPHFGVFHPKKPDKIRVVFDCRAEFKGHSLNRHLLQGPDLNNSLLGILCRFRNEKIAFTCDVEQMFHQFNVEEGYRDYLRFFWWPNGNTDLEPKEYRMTVHLFGAKSSPSCCNFGLNQLASDYEAEVGAAAAEFVRNDFYVDDGLKSVSTESEAIGLINTTQDLFSKGGLRLHKFASNSEEVLLSIPEADRAIKNDELHRVPDINCSSQPLIERALGMYWSISSDVFQYKIVLFDRPLTRRGILSTIGTIYDPLGLIAPIILVGRQILQQLCMLNVDWDGPLPKNVLEKWELWKNDLLSLERVKIPRCFKPADFGKVESMSLHHFSDASTSGYGQCTYVRMVNNKGQVHCSLVMGKARVAPIRPITIPRLELTAAVLSVKISESVRKELRLQVDFEKYWTDSQVVLGYIQNNARRFHVFVANRIQQIRDLSEPDQWGHVKGQDNPADEASRGLTVEKFVTCSKWLSGPSFLWKTDLPDPEKGGHEIHLSAEDPEVKSVSAFATRLKPMSLESSRFNRFSEWESARNAVALCLKFTTLLKAKTSQVDPQPGAKTLKLEDLKQAEKTIIKSIQYEAFATEIEILRKLNVNKNNVQSNAKATQRKSEIKGTSALYRLDPFLDDEGLLRVGGRLRRANLSWNLVHPLILPRTSHITTLILRYYHKIVQHGGRGQTVNAVRQNGFWIIGIRKAVVSLIGKCVKCKRLRGDFQQQKMADLPVDRIQPAPGFTFVGTDVFGPFYITQGRRTQLKKYGVIFTCLSMRAIHIETLNDMTSDSFINALRRFISIRGPMQLLRCDRGTNFVGASNELEKAWTEMDIEKVRRFLLKQDCNLEFEFSVPYASHHNGAWERQIRSVRATLSGMLLNSGSQLDDESLRTLMYEVMAIVNGRPLTTDSLEDPESLLPLTPNQLLTMKSQVVIPPPGEFPQEDLLLHKRWRRVQYLANVFWNRWRKEYLNNLQTRPKWNKVERNMKVGDIVIMKEDDLPRNQWRLARVHEVYVDEDQRVRKVRLAMGNRSLDKIGKRTQEISYLERPVTKLVILLKNEQPE